MSYESKYEKTHQPCADCGSSDALTIYKDGGTYCFSCGKASLPDRDTSDIRVVENNNLTLGDVSAIEQRRIHKETCIKYNVMQKTVKGKSVHIYPYYNSGGFHIASKIRFVPKHFLIEGHIAKTGFFGQQAFGKGGKYITICEGEIDALSAYQMFDSKWPFISVRTGAGSIEKDINDNYDFLNKFENIIICFDNDDAGKIASKVASELLAPKASVVRMRYKDPNEYLLKGKVAEFKQDWWNAERYTPEGIVSGDSLWDELLKGPEKAIVQYPYNGINKSTYGLRSGELVCICAGTGIGKSSFMREICYHIISNTDNNVGLMFLEEPIRTTAKALMGVHSNKNYHLPDADYTMEEYKDAYDNTVGSGRVFFFDHFGSNAIDNIINRIRYMVKILKCKYVILDHISILVSSQEFGMDERKNIDQCMTKLRTLVQELDICLIIASHLRRTQDGSHEEGKELSLNHLRGSHSIGQLSDIVLGLERNGQADCPVERNTTKVRVIKNRFSGVTGLCSTLFYDASTGRLNEVSSENIVTNHVNNVKDNELM